MEFGINGTGYVANLLRNSTNEFHKKKNVLAYETTHKCDYNLKKLTLTEIAEIFLKIVQLVGFIIFEVLAKRFNRVLKEINSKKSRL